MKPALLVIDMQRWFLETGTPEKLASVAALVAGTNALIDFFLARELPIVRVRTVHGADGSTWNQWMKEHRAPRLIEGTREAEDHPGIRAAGTDVVITKTRHSAFIRTDLERILRDLGVDAVVLAGFSTDMCVGLTAVEAWERDFRVLLAGDAILGTSPASGSRMLDYLKDRFVLEPVPVAEIMAILSDGPRPR